MDHDKTSPSRKHNGCEAGTEVFSHHGVVLKNANYNDDSNCNGTLTVNQYSNHVKRIEWKPIAVSEVSDCPEQEEWAMVNTVNQRTRTLSGGGDFRMHPVNIEMREIKSYIVNKRKRELTFLLRDGSSHAFVFQYGTIQDFTYILRACLKTRRSKRRKNLFVVTDDRNESQPLTHSFAELNLFPDNPTDAVWRFVSNLKQRPYETTLETFSKLTDTILYRQPEQRPPEEMAAELVNSLHELQEGGVEVEGYQVIGVSTNLPKRPDGIIRGPPLTMDQWKEAMDDEGRIANPQRIKEIIFKGGICRPLRFIVWKFLLGYFPWDSTATERQEIQKKKAEDYFRMKLQWRTMSQSQEDNFADYRDRKSLIEKDVNRTDRTMDFFAGENNPNLLLLNDILMTYIMYNFDLGYVQGMSDLLSPILILMSNEVDAFWCFVGFMDRVSSNFDLDQAGMKTQLSALFGLVSAADQKLAQYLDHHDSANMFFCFRWLLVLFKREFSNDDIMTLWEVLWTDLPCPNFHLLVSLAILDAEKDILIENSYGFTEILKHINDLSLKIDLNSTLNTAEAIYKQFSMMPDLPLPIKKLIGLAPESSENDSQDDNSSTSCEDNNDCDNDISIIHSDSEEEGFEKGISNHYV